jgi:ferric-dicitrate binding protein FerR (iron transport regulator)
MEKDSTYYIGLITKYLSGEASEKEIRSLHKWLKADAAHQTEFDAHRKAWIAIERSNFDKDVNIDSEWALLQTKMNVQEEQEEERVPLIPFIVQRLARRKRKNPALRIAAIMLILIGVSMVFIINRNPEEKIMVAQNGVQEQSLPDGTEISLNSGAKLSYPAEFKGNIRQVTLEGEACFKVTHDASKPFVISVGTTRIKVLGTSFYVNTHNKNGNLEVVLSSGSVLVYNDDNPSEKAMLAPGDKVEVNEAMNEIVKTQNTDPNIDSWSTKRLIFTNNTLGEITEALKRTYHADIQIDTKALETCRMTASFENQSLESVLKVLAATLDLKVKRTGQVFVFSGNGCK